MTNADIILKLGAPSFTLYSFMIAPMKKVHTHRVHKGRVSLETLAGIEIAVASRNSL
jgi:hypothetical protein